MTATTTRTLASFLSDRLAEDERRVTAYVDEDPASAWHALGCGLNDEPSTWCECPVPARVLAEVVAKRAIVALHTCVCSDGCGECGECSGLHHADPTPAPCATLRHLAAVYAHAPGYDSAWAVS